MATTNPLQFIQQVRAEVSKVVWPTRREVMLTTTMFVVAGVESLSSFMSIFALNLAEHEAARRR